MRKIIRVFIALILTTTTLFTIVDKQAQAADSWIDISTPEDLHKIRNNLDANYRLVNNIDLSEWGSWQPILEFEGVLDGQNYTIKNMTINEDNDENRYGFFGKTRGATITNLKLEDIYISVYTRNLQVRTGGLIGESIVTSISNVYVTGEIDSIYTGGLVGDGQGVHISNGHTDVEITSQGNVGGLVAYITDTNNLGTPAPGIVEYSSSSGNIIASTTSYGVNGVGGLVGYMTKLLSATNIVHSSYSTGNITLSDESDVDDRRFGGAVGYLRGPAIVRDVYSTGDVTSFGDNVGGLIGELNGVSSHRVTVNTSYSTGSVGGVKSVGGLIGKRGGTYTIGENNYWNTDLAGVGTSAGGTGKSTDLMMERNTYEGWNFTDVWTIEEGKRYPTLQSNPENSTNRPGDGYMGEGSGGSDGNDGSDGENNNGEENGTTTNTNDVLFELGTGGLFLETSPINNFGIIPLTGSIEHYTTTFQNPFKVTDLRGTLEGWKVNVSATQFKVVEPEAGFVEGTEANVLPTGTLLLSNDLEVTSIDPQTTTLPNNSLTDITAIDGGSVQVVEALQGEGAGEYNITFSENALTLVIDPATAKVDNVNYLGKNTPYESTLTWDLVSAP